MKYVLLVLALSFNASAANPPCDSFKGNKSIDTKIATASTWANMSGSSNSIKATLNSGLEESMKDLESAVPADFKCPDYCQAKPQVTVVFTSTPKEYLKDYSDFKKCETYLEQTKKDPIIYNNLSFNSLAELNGWFGDFSQGNGKEGKDLYNKCDGKCSPAYSCFIVKDGNKLKTYASVICGHARDKADNQYAITFAYAWSCLSK